MGLWEHQLITKILQEPPDGLTAVGMNSCLTAVNQHAVQVLVVPVGGLITGFACEVCGALASTPEGCIYGQPASRPVPDLLEEMAVATLDEEGEVPRSSTPGDVAARLRYPLTPTHLSHDHWENVGNSPVLPPRTSARIPSNHLMGGPGVCPSKTITNRQASSGSPGPIDITNFTG
jgi:hypothetical protein